MATEPFCWNDLDSDGECNCGSLVQLKGDCYVDLSDPTVAGLFWFESISGAVLHGILMFWAIWLLASSLWRDRKNPRQMFKQNLFKVKKKFSLCLRIAIENYKMKSILQ